MSEKTPDAQKSVPDNETIVCLFGELEIDGKKVSVAAKSGAETLVQLDKPAPLGNVLTVGTWLNDSWETYIAALVPKKERDANNKVGSQQGVTVDEVKTHLKTQNFPEQIIQGLAELFLVDIVITDLYVRLWKEPIENKDADGKAVVEKEGGDRKAFKFGIAVNFANVHNARGLNLFGEIYLKNVKFGIINAPKGYDFEANKLVLPPLRLLTSEEAEKEAPKEVGRSA